MPVVASAQNEATIQQVGTHHVVALQQFATGGGARALIEQAGTGHTIRLEQASGAFAEIVQSGTGNGLFGISLAGTGSILEAARSIQGATLLLMQSGMNNLAFVDQAAGAYASITQSGTGNTVTLIQR